MYLQNNTTSTHLPLSINTTCTFDARYQQIVAPSRSDHLARQAILSTVPAQTLPTGCSLLDAVDAMIQIATTPYGAVHIYMRHMTLTYNQGEVETCIVSCLTGYCMHISCRSNMASTENCCPQCYDPINLQLKTVINSHEQFLCTYTVGLFCSIGAMAYSFRCCHSAVTQHLIWKMAIAHCPLSINQSINQSTKNL